MTKRSARPGIHVRRAYDPPEPADGTRVLVDRLWPRGLRKEDAAVDEWPKDLTPSGELRREFHAGRVGHDEFAARYRAELDAPAAAVAVEHVAALARAGTVTLVTAAKDVAAGHVPVLVERVAEVAEALGDGESPAGGGDAEDAGDPKDAKDANGTEDAKGTEDAEVPDPDRRD